MRKSSSSAAVCEVIVYTETIGDGVEGNPFRTLTVVRAKDGTFIAENDPLDGAEVLTSSQAEFFEKGFHVGYSRANKDAV